MSCVPNPVPIGQPVYYQDPNEVLDWTWDWRKWLKANGDDTFSSTVDPVLISEDNSIELASAPIIEAGLVSAFLKFPTNVRSGDIGQITCRIVTTAGRTKDWTIYFAAQSA